MASGVKADSDTAYRKVYVKMYADARYRALSPTLPSGRSLWHALIHGEHTTIIPGVLRVGEAGFAESLGWSVEAFREAFREVSMQGMAKADWEARMIWLPNAVKYNPPTSPNVVRSWAGAWPYVPECGLKREVLLGLRAFIEGKSEAFAKAFREAFAEDLPKPESREQRAESREQREEKKRKEKPAREPQGLQEPSKPEVSREPVRDAGGYGVASLPKLEDAVTQALSYMGDQDQEAARRVAEHWDGLLKAEGLAGVRWRAAAQWVTRAVIWLRADGVEDPEAWLCKMLDGLAKSDRRRWTAPGGKVHDRFFKASWVFGGVIGAWGNGRDTSVAVVLTEHENALSAGSSDDAGLKAHVAQMLARYEKNEEIRKRTLREEEAANAAR